MRHSSDRNLKPETGGQWNLSGILYQLLITLRSGLAASVQEITVVGDVASVRITVEPRDGGDSQISAVGGPIIDQIKIRRGQTPWTTRGLVEKVLPDLYQAMAGSASTTRFRFVTDNLAGTQKFDRFLRACAAQATLGPDRLDDLKRVYGWGSHFISARTLFDRIAEQLAPTDRPSVWKFVQRLTVVGLSRTQVAADVNAMLADLVDHPSQVAVRRKALTAALLELGSTGSQIDAGALLRSVDLDPDRLAHFHRLPEILRSALDVELRHQKYDRALDVRPEPTLPETGVAVFSGGSGQGKTWRLCQAALTVAEAGHCVVMLPAMGDVAELEQQVLKRVWPATMGGAVQFEWVAHVLQRKLAPGSVWLTVFLDDLADPGLAREIQRSDWTGLGVRLVMSAQDPFADFLKQLSPSTMTIPVPDYNLSELRERLRRAGRDPALIPDDVMETLTRPILADLYCRIPGSETWTGVSEYALMDGYWTWASRQHRDQSLHRADASALYDLADTLLDGQGVYPWPPSLLRQRNISFDTIARLSRNGVLTEDADGAVALSHSRLLNWIVAASLARRFRQRQLDVTGLSNELEHLDDLRTSGGDAVGRRLNYVLYDVFWMLAGSASAEDVGRLAVRCLGSKTERLEDSNFFDAGLATIGARILPALDWMARRDAAEIEPATRWAIADALSRIGDHAEKAVADVAISLIRSDEGQSRSIGLKVLSKVSAPDGLDDLWRIHCARHEAFHNAKATDDEWHKLYRANQTSFAALKPSLRARPDWVVQAAPRLKTALDADQMLWLIDSLDWEAGAHIWKVAKTDLLRKVRPEDRGAARMIRRFRDTEEQERIEAGLAQGGINAMAWLHTQARLDPGGALRTLTEVDPTELSATSSWWLPGLAARTGGAVHEALRKALGAFGVEGDPVLMDLCQIYQAEPDLLAPVTLDLLIDNYELCLERDAAGATGGRITRRYIRSLLSELTSPALLDRLARRAGSRFETLLTEKAISGSGRVSMTVDRDNAQYHQILAAIGGGGYDQLVLAELDRPNMHGRTDGVTAAQWTRSHAVREKLEAIARDADPDTYRRVQLMQTLASHHNDVGLEAMIRSGSPVFLAAVDIRSGGPPMESAAVEQIRARLVHPDRAERIIAINQCGFLGADVAGDLLSPLILAETDEEEVVLVISIFNQIGYYRPEFLRVVKGRLDRGERGISAALYLVSHGDAEARAALVDWLDAHPLTRLSSSEMPIVLHLVKFEDSRRGALRFLKRMRATRLGRGSEGLILSLLAEDGDETAAQDLHAVANQTPRFGPGPVVAAIRGLSRRLPMEGQAAAERLFRRTHDMGAAALLLRADRQLGLRLLLAEYPAMTVGAQWDLGRLLRRAGEHDETLAHLRTTMTRPCGAQRRMAAELAGWFPFENACDWLAEAVDDPDPAVENAALDALRRREADRDAAELIATLPAQPRSRQWSWLCAIIELSDPAHLVTFNDPRSLQQLLDHLGEDFAQEADRRMDARTKSLQAEAKKRQTALE